MIRSNVHRYGGYHRESWSEEARNCLSQRKNASQYEKYGVVYIRLARAVFVFDQNERQEVRVTLNSTMK